MAKKSKAQNDIQAMLANENIVTKDIVEEMENDALVYSIMTILDRALPDVRDGMKPVQRRILYSMFTQGMTPDKPHRKSAGVTGDVIRWLHPHSSSYDALTNMVNDFDIRYRMIDGQGNFGSVDGDPAAAERYTECRLDKLALLMLKDIKKYNKADDLHYNDSIVDFMPNFAEEELEPEYLPAAIPYFLLNGAVGIATGYATNTPSHNLNEILDGIIHLIKHEKATVDDLMQFVKGPDLPSRGYLLNSPNIRQLYETGQASLRFRGKIIQEVNEETGNTMLVITELPPDLKKANVDPKKKTPNLMEKLYELCIEKKEIPGVIDIRDVSEGKEDEETGLKDNLIRIEIELNKTAIPKVVMDLLYKKTQLEKSVGYFMRCVVDNVPRTLSLKEAMQYFIDHRRDVITRTLSYDVKDARAKLHIQEGKHIALANIDDVVHIIRNEKDPDKELMKRFSLSEIQVKAIMEIPLRSLKKLEEDKLLKSIKELQDFITKCEKALNDPKEVDKLLIHELKQIKEEFGDDRKTVIIDVEAIEEAHDEQVSDEPMKVIVTSKGNIKVIPETAYDQAFNNGALRERTDVYIHAITAKMSNEFVLVTDDGHYAKVTFSDLLGNLDFLEGKKPIAVFKYEEESVLVTFNANGQVKKTTFATLKARNKRVAELVSCEASPLVGVRLSDGSDDNVITVATKGTIVHRFMEKGFNATAPGRGAVPGISLAGTDEVVDFQITKLQDDKDASIMLYTKNDKGEFAEKRMDLSEFAPKGRVSKGITGTSIGKKDTAQVFGIKIVKDDFHFLDQKGLVVKRKLNDLAVSSRAKQATAMEDNILVLH